MNEKKEKNETQELLDLFLVWKKDLSEREIYSIVEDADFNVTDCYGSSYRFFKKENEKSIKVYSDKKIPEIILKTHLSFFKKIVEQALKIYFTFFNRTLHGNMIEMSEHYTKSIFRDYWFEILSSKKLEERIYFLKKAIEDVLKLTVNPAIYISIKEDAVEIDQFFQLLEDIMRYIWPEGLSLSEFFDTQMDNLQKNGCPKNIIDAFVAKKLEVVNRASKIEIGDGHISFLAVIPRTVISLSDLFDMARRSNTEEDEESTEKWYKYDQQRITDIESNLPCEIYFMYDIDIFSNVVVESPEEAERRITEAGRLSVTIDECVNICIFTDKLKYHGLHGTGSRWNGVDVPTISSSVIDQVPKLSFSSLTVPSNKNCTLSCKCRF